MDATFSIRASLKRSGGFTSQLDAERHRLSASASGLETISSRIIDVSAALLFCAGKLLITRRRAADHLGGLWEFPGGKVEAGESFEQALTRELREELGIGTAVHNELQEIVHSYPEKTVRLKFFRCSLLEGEPRALHCEDFAWVTRDELGEYAFPAADARLLAMLRTSDAVWSD
jgi:mutator protein MutT